MGFHLPCENPLKRIKEGNMLLMIDNYDSFTYNLVQYFGELDEDVRVFRNDKITINEIEQMKPEGIVISPGPCTPREAGISIDVIKHFAGKVPILGVCLGHQSIGSAFGGEIVRAPNLMHGKTSLVYHDGKTIFEGLPNPFEATRYHSLIIKRETLPDCLEVTAWTYVSEESSVERQALCVKRQEADVKSQIPSSESEIIIMGVRHKEFIVEGVQFHPESILTAVGKDLLRNFIKLR
jgi:anthranilate synthase/aminodeoxychorismate synthase-like glutamine amidotransferase